MLKALSVCMCNSMNSLCILMCAQKSVLHIVCVCDIPQQNERQHCCQLLSYGKWQRMSWPHVCSCSCFSKRSPVSTQSSVILCCWSGSMRVLMEANQGHAPCFSSAWSIKYLHTGSFTPYSVQQLSWETSWYI